MLWLTLCARAWAQNPTFEYVDLNGGFGDLGDQDNPYMENTEDDWLLAVFDEPTDPARCGSVSAGTGMQLRAPMTPTGRQTS